MRALWSSNPFPYPLCLVHYPPPFRHLPSRRGPRNAALDWNRNLSSSVKARTINTYLMDSYFSATLRIPGMAGYKEVFDPLNELPKRVSEGRVTLPVGRGAKG